MNVTVYTRNEGVKVSAVRANRDRSDEIIRRTGIFAACFREKEKRREREGEMDRQIGGKFIPLWDKVLSSDSITKELHN